MEERRKLAAEAAERAEASRRGAVRLRDLGVMAAKAQAQEDEMAKRTFDPKGVRRSRRVNSIPATSSNAFQTLASCVKRHEVTWRLQYRALRPCKGLVRLACVGAASFAAAWAVLWTGMWAGPGTSLLTRHQTRFRPSLQ